MRKRLLGSMAAAAVLAILPLLVLSSQSASGQAKGKGGKPAAPKGVPAPRRADGHPDFSGVYNSPGYGPGDPRSKTGEGNAHNIARDLDPSEVPLLPWAKAALEKRSADLEKDDPEGYCLPMGTPRVNPYPWKIVQSDKLIVILYEGNVHQYRQIFLDGRAHDPSVKETFWGDSIGRWEGDTLVIDTVGLGFGDGKNTMAWLDADGHPRTNKLHVIERWTRKELGYLTIDITIDDPGAYSKPWTVHQVAQLAPGWEIEENICNENQDEKGNNLDVQHLKALK